MKLPTLKRRRPPEISDGLARTIAGQVAAGTMTVAIPGDDESPVSIDAGALRALRAERDQMRGALIAIGLMISTATDDPQAHDFLDKAFQAPPRASRDEMRTSS